MQQVAARIDHRYGRRALDFRTGRFARRYDFQNVVGSQGRSSAHDLTSRTKMDGHVAVGVRRRQAAPERSPITASWR
jgi:hypothetical protein